MKLVEKAYLNLKRMSAYDIKHALPELSNGEYYELKRDPENLVKAPYDLVEKLANIGNDSYGFNPITARFYQDDNGTIYRVMDVEDYDAVEPLLDDLAGKYGFKIIYEKEAIDEENFPMDIDPCNIKRSLDENGKVYETYYNFLHEQHVYVVYDSRLNLKQAHDEVVKKFGEKSEYTYIPGDYHQIMQTLINMDLVEINKIDGSSIFDRVDEDFDEIIDGYQIEDPAVLNSTMNQTVLSQEPNTPLTPESLDYYMQEKYNAHLMN